MLEPAVERMVWFALVLVLSSPAPILIVGSTGLHPGARSRSDWWRTLSERAWVACSTCVVAGVIVLVRRVEVEFPLVAVVPIPSDFVADLPVLDADRRIVVSGKEFIRSVVRPGRLGPLPILLDGRRARA